MKIAFTSCLDARKKPSQTVWSHILRHQPDALVLLGDTIYMDYMLGLVFNKPRKWSDEKFANKCYARYRLQAGVPEFREILGQVADFQSIWDDHDFAWNNAYVTPQGRKSVSLNKRLISKGLRAQFMAWARGGAIEEYPDQPTMTSLLAEQPTGIEAVVDLPQARLILLDTRSYREKKNRRRTGSIIGEVQKAWLLNAINSAPNPCLVCSGTPLTGAKEGWDRYQDFAWVKKNIPDKTVFISGDIHENQLNSYVTDAGKVYDITASGAARPLGSWTMPGKDASGNYGIIEIIEGNIQASCYYYDNLQHQKLIG